ncbi:MAG: hypothetical protein JNM68_02940, partial [Dinghuibacter sp.]|nr:hypothetical protein [Dinghuibacter sp.]
MNMMRKLCPLLFFLLLVNEARTQGVYVKDIQHNGIPCVLLANEKTGIVVPKAADAKTPRNQLLLAPIQAIRLPNGSLTGTEPVMLEPASDVRECSAYPFFTDGYGGKEMPVKSRTLAVNKTSATEITMVIRYDIAKPDNKATRDKRNDKGYYTCTISLKAGEPVVMIEDETDWNFSYKLETGRNLFNQARYRGRYSSSLEEGYMLVNGKKEVYKNETEYPGHEAITDLPFDAPLASCAPYRHYQAISQWNLWPTGTGWYWQWYHTQGNAQSPVVGLFHGRASRLLGASCVQVNLFTRSDNRAAGIRININRTNPSRYYSRKVRVQWGIFTGVKGTDLVASNESSPLLKWFNRKSGIAEKFSVYEKKQLSVAPEMEWGAFYQDKNAVQQMVQKARKDPAFVRLLSEQDVQHKLLFEAWAGNACSLAKLYHMLKTHYESFKEMCTNGQGIYAQSRVQKFTGECREKEVVTDDAAYLRASDWFRRDVLLAGGLMAGARAGAFTLSRSQKDSLNMFSAVYAQILWDNDFVPLAYNAKETEDEVNVDHGVNYGQINMLVTFQAGRDFFALLYRNDPQFKSYYNDIIARAKKIMGDVINEHGASTASPHYTQPTLEGLVLLLLQLKQQGSNLFATEPRLHAFARFYLNLLTPPSVRFADNRKLVSFGDGSEESAALFGLLATGFRSGNEALAADLDAAFCNGPMRSLPKAGVMALVYDYTRATGNKQLSSLGSASIPGYLSHFRT